jgi:hypothetical protein
MKVELMPGIENISGSMKSKRGARLVFKTYSKGRDKKETRAYWVRDSSYKRTSPLSDKERNAKTLFAMRVKYVNERVRMGIDRKQAWDEARKKFPTDPL